MPSLAATARAEAKPYAATVLATSEAGGGQVVPAVAYRPAGTLGSGRVVVVEGAGMWRWAFLPPQHQDRDELYGAFWRSLVRWLVTNVGLLPSQRMALRTDKATFTTEETAAATLLVRENRWSGGLPQLELAGPELKRPQTVACKPWGNVPGQYHADLGRLRRRPLPAPRGRRRQGGTRGRDGVGCPRQPEGTAGRGRPAGHDGLDRPAERRRGARAGRSATRSPGSSTSICSAAGRERMIRTPGLGPLVGAASARSPFGARAGGFAAGRD